MVERRGITAASTADDHFSRSNNGEDLSGGQDSEQFWRNIPGADVLVVTSEGKGISAHSDVLASASPVLESLIHRRHLKRGGSSIIDKKNRQAATCDIVVVPILGVPQDAVVAFLRCLYNNAGFSSCPTSKDAPEAAPPVAETTSTEASKYGVHLLVLSHVFQVPCLKRTSASALSGSLTPDNVVDMLQLARQCDAPDLFVRCMSIIRLNFKEVQLTEGWWFLQRSDPWLELEVLERIEEEERSLQRMRRRRKEIEVYAELGEAMECLEHVCSQGCQLMQHKYERPQQGKDRSSTLPCAWGDICRGLQQLILHFATCKWRKKLGSIGGCKRCTHLWQLLHLHAALCNQDTDHSSCKVPFCRQFKHKAAVQTTGSKEEAAAAGRWRLLANKVASAKVVLSISKRKRDQPPLLGLNQSECTAMSDRT